MNIILIAVSFCAGFACRFIQLSLVTANMSGQPLPFNPYGDLWCLFSSFAYGLVCLFTIVAITQCDKKPGITCVAIALTSTLLLADFAKPSRFEEGTYLDHAISKICSTHADAFHDQLSVAKSFGSLAKL